MAVVQDPTGAVFALWQARTHKGAGVVNVPNSFCWNELMTTDTAKAGEFYTGLFGWGKRHAEHGPMEYTMFTNGDRPAGGMFKMTPEMGNIPPHWLVYFAVDDCDAKTQKANELGGKTAEAARRHSGHRSLLDPDSIPGRGFCAYQVARIPQSASLTRQHNWKQFDFAERERCERDLPLAALIVRSDRLLRIRTT